MKLIKTANYDDMSKMAADIIAAQMVAKPDSVLGLATGSSPIGTYKELIKRNKAGEIDFSHITTVNLDEYVGLPRENDQSYYYFMNDQLFNHVNIDKTRTSVPSGMATDAEEECSRYEELIRSLGGVDLQLLGLGHNGHIGFNEPDVDFSKVTHCVELQESTINANKRFFASIDDVPRKAYTMGIGTIMRAKKIVMVVSGSDKAEIVRKAFTGPVTPSVPASILQFHPDVTVICDAEAYSKLEAL